MYEGNHGLVGEAKVIAHYLDQGYHVFPQFGGKAPFDMVIYRDGILKRVSVKSTSQSRIDRKMWTVKIATSHHNATGKVRKHFDKESCDILAIYIIPEDRIVFYDSVDINAKNSISIAKL